MTSNNISTQPRLTISIPRTIEEEKQTMSTQGNSPQHSNNTSHPGNSPQGSTPQGSNSPQGSVAGSPRISEHSQQNSISELELEDDIVIAPVSISVN